jgi:hypothetical protein
LPRPAAFELHVQREAQKCSHPDHDRQYADPAERRGDGYGADDVRGDEKLETEQIGFAYLLAVDAVGIVSRGASSQPYKEATVPARRPTTTTTTPAPSMILEIASTAP